MKRTLLAALLVFAAAPASADDVVDDRTSTIADVSLWTNNATVLLHQFDHFARDHMPVPIYYISFAIVPAQIALDRLDYGPAVWIPLHSIVLFFDVAGHYVLHDVDVVSGAYGQWADGENRFDKKSPVLGSLSVANTSLMILSRSVHLATNIIEAKRHGFTLKRHPRARDLPIAVVPSTDGAMIVTGWQF